MEFELSNVKKNREMAILLEHLNRFKKNSSGKKTEKPQ